MQFGAKIWVLLDFWENDNRLNKISKFVLIFNYGSSSICELVEITGIVEGRGGKPCTKWRCYFHFGTNSLQISSCKYCKYKINSKLKFEVCRLLNMI